MLQDVTFIHLRICVTTVGLFGRPIRYLHRTISPRRPLLEGVRERGSDAFWEGNINTAGVYRSFLKPYPPTPPPSFKNYLVIHPFVHILPFKIKIIPTSFLFLLFPLFISPGPPNDMTIVSTPSEEEVQL